ANAAREEFLPHYAIPRCIAVPCGTALPASMQGKEALQRGTPAHGRMMDQSVAFAWDGVDEFEIQRSPGGAIGLGQARAEFGCEIAVICRIEPQRRDAGAGAELRRGGDQPVGRAIVMGAAAIAPSPPAGKADIA